LGPCEPRCVEARMEFGRIGWPIPNFEDTDHT
jgi:hypothetical protein